MDRTAKFESLSPNLLAADVNKTVDFYTKTLGFNLIASVPETGVFNWAMLMRNGVTMMFQSKSSFQEDLPSLKISTKGDLGTFYIKVKGLESLYISLKGKAEIVVDMRTTFYGAKEFAIKDLDGYYLMFSEDAA